MIHKTKPWLKKKRIILWKIQYLSGRCAFSTMIIGAERGISETSSNSNLEGHEPRSPDWVAVSLREILL